MDGNNRVKKLTKAQQKIVNDLLDVQRKELFDKHQEELDDYKQLNNSNNFLGSEIENDEGLIPECLDTTPYDGEERKVDVFERCELLHKDGKYIKYVIYRNNSFVGELMPPCSWQIVQANFGG